MSGDATFESALFRLSVASWIVALAAICGGAYWLWKGGWDE